MSNISQSTESDEAEVVALLAPSNLDYVASIFALSRLGFAVLLLSNRLATEAYVSLLQKTNCRRIISSENHAKAVAAIQADMQISQYPLFKQSDYDIEDSAGLLLLGAAAECVGRIEQARALVEKDGPLIPDRFGVPRPHPMLAVEHDARAQLLLTLKQLHLDLEPLEPRPGRPDGGKW